MTKDEADQLTEVIDDVKSGSEEKNLVKILHRVQNIFGHLPREVQVKLAEELEIPLSEIYSVVSFYSLFTTEDRGELTIEVCMGTACYVKGSEDILTKLKEELEIAPGETTEDGKYSLETTRCIGACGKAPVVVKGDDVCGGLEMEDIPDLVSEG